MNLSQAIRSLVEAKGINILKSPLSINILSDYNAFNEYPSSKNILKNIISEGYLDKIVFFYDNGIPIGDAPLTYASELYHQMGFRADISNYVLNAILEALGFESILSDISKEEEFQIQLSDKSLSNQTSDQESAHIVFNGISLNNNMNSIASKLSKKGFDVIERDSKRIQLNGEFCGDEDVDIMIFGNKNGLTSCVRAIIKSLSVFQYELNEEKYIKLLTTKYGSPVIADKNYTNCEILFDDVMYFDLIDSSKEALEYRWDVKGGYIELHTITGSLFIEYVDTANSKTIKKQSEQSNLDSI